MADIEMMGCSWGEIPAGRWKMRPNSGLAPTSRCQLEADASWEAVVAHAPEGAYSRLAPFRIFSFDIECAGRKGLFASLINLIYILVVGFLNIRCLIFCDILTFT